MLSATIIETLVSRQRSSGAEQLFCKQQVDGSNPSVGSIHISYDHGLQSHPIVGNITAVLRPIPGSIYMIFIDDIS